MTAKQLGFGTTDLLRIGAGVVPGIVKGALARNGVQTTQAALTEPGKTLDLRGRQTGMTRLFDAGRRALHNLLLPTTAAMEGVAAAIRDSGR